MTIVNRNGQSVTSKKTMDELPMISCQAKRPKSVEEQDVIIKCGGQVFLLGMIYKLDADGDLGEKKNTVYPMQTEVCAICGAMGSKGVDVEANAFGEALEKNHK